MRIAATGTMKFHITAESGCQSCGGTGIRIYECDEDKLVVTRIGFCHCAKLCHVPKQPNQFTRKEK
jgi:hypothetical protein